VLHPTGWTTKAFTRYDALQLVDCTPSGDQVEQDIGEGDWTRHGQQEKRPRETERRSIRNAAALLHANPHEGTSKSTSEAAAEEDTEAKS